MFITCFHILKRSLHSPLLLSVLQCIGKFAHMLNIDFITDLIRNLERVMEEEDIPLEVSIQVECSTRKEKGK
jgi:hypothetical protein